MMFARLFHEPLVHFLGIGLSLFALHALVAPANRGGMTIVVSRAAIEALKAQHEQLQGRPPTEAELAGLIDSHVADEIMYREGRAMGLDRDDSVIKRRVRQKYELIAEEEESATPTEADLAAYLKANPEKFRRPPVVGFTQVMVASDGSADAVRARADALLASLAAGANPATAGKTTLLPTRVEALALDLVARDFGAQFAAALLSQPEGTWAGPVASAYGLHLVRVDARTPAADPSLESARAEVQREWENERRQRTRAARLAELRKRYGVVVEK